MSKVTGSSQADPAAPTLPPLLAAPGPLPDTSADALARPSAGSSPEPPEHPVSTAPSKAAPATPRRIRPVLTRMVAPHPILISRLTVVEPSDTRPCGIMRR
ncbi:hypothetical protein [Streptomyces sp. SS1-1]|uniref:hypothetical protein n=1 Tax=Streptomyces sp. SS1-1 TaxID=2651869 RepID=UPI00299067EB|nr:hypothetical protein [Streptomyces sp. SS1-1]